MINISESQLWKDPVVSTTPSAESASQWPLAQAFQHYSQGHGRRQKVSGENTCAIRGPNQRSGSILWYFGRDGPDFPLVRTLGSRGFIVPQMNTETIEHRSPLIKHHLDPAPVSDATHVPWTGLWETPTGRPPGNMPFSNRPSGCVLRYIRKEPESATSLILGTVEFSCFMWDVLLQEVPGFQMETWCFCLEHLALGNAQYLQPVKYDVKQAGLLTPASSEIQNKQLDESEPSMCCRSITPNKTRAMISPTDFTSSLAKKTGCWHIVLLLPYTLKGLIESSGSLLNNLNPRPLWVFVCLYEMLTSFLLFLKAL